jgi:hypothetical protein
MSTTTPATTAKKRTFATIAPYGETPVERVLWSALFVKGFNGRRGLPYILVGKPGRGKTSLIERLSRVAGLYHQTLNGSLRPPQDFLGIPVPGTLERSDENNDLFLGNDQSMMVADYAPFRYAIRAAEARNSLLFFDEANTVGEDVQAAMLRVVLEGVIGEMRLPPGVRMMLAMNKPEDTSGAWDFKPAMVNRLGFINWEGGELSSFSEYLVNSGGVGATGLTLPQYDPTEVEDSVDALWPEAWAEAVGVVSGFLRRRPEFFRKEPAKGVAPGPFPADRSWEFATKALTGSIIFGLDETERMIACSAAVGAEAWAELEKWHRAADLPDPGMLLDGEEQFTHQAARLDRTAAVLNSCKSLVLNDFVATRQEKRLAAFWALMNNLVAKHPDAMDLVFHPVVTLCKKRMMNRNADAYALVGRINPLITKAGIDIGSFA